MTRDTIVAIIDHGKSAVVYIGCGVGFIVATLGGNTEAATALAAFMAGGAVVQGGSAIASKVKSGGGE
jgi:hypothetical protein